jgi:hypothetical protein
MAMLVEVVKWVPKLMSGAAFCGGGERREDRRDRYAAVRSRWLLPISVAEGVTHEPDAIDSSWSVMSPSTSIMAAIYTVYREIGQLYEV